MSFASTQTVDELAREWWRQFASKRHAASTRITNAVLWDKHAVPRIGTLKLANLSASTVARFRDDLLRDGVGAPTVTKTLALLSGICSWAVEQGRMHSNPVKAIRKPRVPRKRAVRPIAPATVEAVRGKMPTDRDAALISLLAYAGLRPGEALALRWRDVQERTILVERAISLGEEKDTKTGKRRTVRLVAPLAQELRELRLLQGRPAEDALIFPRSKDGLPWVDTDWRNWRRRVFKVAADAVGLVGIRPYDLRHSFVSLLIAEGRSIVEVARQAGHSPVMALNTYGHVMEELEGAEGVSAEEIITAARATPVLQERARAATS